MNWLPSAISLKIVFYSPAAFSVAGSYRPLVFTSVPVSVTFAVFGDVGFADPSLEDERHCDGQVTIALDVKQNLCYLHQVRVLDIVLSFVSLPCGYRFDPFARRVELR